MAERAEDDTIMLDDWEEEESERGERGHGKQEIYSVSIFLSILGTLGSVELTHLMREGVFGRDVCNNGL
jgi:hypothetical protein